MFRIVARTVLCLLVTVFVSCKTVDTYYVYVGTYTNGDAEGIYVCELDLATGALTKVGVRDGVVNPSFLAIHPSGDLLYAVSEVSNLDGKKTGGVAAFSIDRATGNLTLLNIEPSHGTAACHISLDESGRTALVANYGGGTVSAFPIAMDGKLQAAASIMTHEGSSVAPNQKSPHPHCVYTGPTNRLAFVSDLGIDQIVIYRLDAATGKLTPNEPAFAKLAPGSGPRHLDFHPSGKFAYVINENNMTVTAFAYDAKSGALTEIETVSTLPEGTAHARGFSTAEIRAHPSGKFLYGSNRGHDSIVVYQVDQSTGRLTFVETEPTQGKTPRNFAIDPTGTYLLAENQSTSTIVVMKIDQTTGALTPTGHTLEIPTPVCVRFLAKE